MQKELKALVESLFKDIYPLNEKFGSSAFTNLINLCREQLTPNDHYQTIKLFYYNGNGPFWSPIAELSLNYKNKLDINLNLREVNNSWIFKFLGSINDEFLYTNKVLKGEDLTKYNIETANDFAKYLNKQSVNNIGIFAVWDNNKDFWFSTDFVKEVSYNTPQRLEKLLKSKLIGAIIIKNDNKILEPLKKFNEKIKQRKEYKKPSPPSELLSMFNKKPIKVDNEKKQELIKKLKDLNWFQDDIDRKKEYYAKKYSPAYSKQLNDIIVNLSKSKNDLETFKQARNIYLKSCNWPEDKSSDEKLMKYLRNLLWTFITDDEGHGWIAKDFNGYKFITEGVLALFLKNQNFYDWWKNFYLYWNPQGMYVDKFNKGEVVNKI